MRRAALLLILLLAAACTGAPGGTEQAATAPAPADAAVEGAPSELAFTADLVGGGTFDGAGYAGSDLLLWFWAPW